MMGPVSTGSPGRSIVHIGTHKTGTTAFQHYMRQNEEHFRGRGLSYYLQRSGSPQAHELPLIALRRDLTIPLRVNNPDLTLLEALPAMRSAIQDFLRDNSDRLTFFSHEGLSFLRDPEETDALRTLLGPNRRTEILLVLRAKESFLDSWRHQLRSMGFNDSSLYRSSFMYTESDSWLVDHDALIATYASAFGSENVTVLSYEDEVARYGSIIPALLRVCGQDLNTLPPGWNTVRNVGPTNVEPP